MSGFTTFPGVISVFSGIVQLLGMQTLEGAMLLSILVSANIILRPMFEKEWR